VEGTGGNGEAVRSDGKVELSGLVPLDRIEATLGEPLQVQRIQTADLTRVLRDNSDALFGIAASAWHRIVTAGRFKVDPMQMREYFEREDPGLARAVEKVIGQPLLKEFGFLRATIRVSGRAFVVATSCAAHLHSDELHLYDIAIADPRHPLTQRERKSDIQHHRGFGLLSEVMSNIFAAAQERNCSMVTLTAASHPLVDVFSRYSFVVEHNSFARDAMKFGMGIPMEAAV